MKRKNTSKCNNELRIQSQDEDIHNNHSKLDDIVRTFRYLNITLSNLRIHNIATSFSKVSESFEKLSGYPLLLIDLEIILFISHSIFQVHWQKIHEEYQMFISFPSHDKDDLRPTSVEERILRFGYNNFVMHRV